MGIELLVYIFIYLCVCVAIFDVAYLFHIRYSAWVLPKRRQRFLAQLHDRQAAETDGPAFQVPNKLKQKLRHPPQFIAFMEALRLLQQTDANLLQQLKSGLVDLFFYLQPYYQRRTSEYRAYFTYQIAWLRFGNLTKQTPETIALLDRLAAALLDFLESESVYERENACKAIFSLGNCNNAMKAVKRFSKNPEHVNSKLLCDQMLRFTGDQKELANSLLASFDLYSPRIQVAVIDYMRFLPKSILNQQPFFPKLAALLTNDKTNKEVRLAVIRYFRRYPYPPLFPALTGFVQQFDSQNWEYAAVAASSLASYPGAATLAVLQTAVASPNWYVRFNAAESLIALGVDCQPLTAGHTDAYAREMLQYRSQVKRLEKKGQVSE